MNASSAPWSSPPSLTALLSAWQRIDTLTCASLVCCVAFLVAQKNDGIGGFVMGRLSTRAYALSIGALYVHMPVSPNHHLTGAKYKEKRNSVSELDAPFETLSKLGRAPQKQCMRARGLKGVHTAVCRQLPPALL